MKKNAFTLIELIATIGLLGMLATITITISVRKINETKEKARDTMIESIELAAKQYVTDKGSEILEFNNYDNAYITLQTLVEKEYFTESLIDPTTKKSLPLTNEVYVIREESGEIESTYNVNQRKEPKLTLIGSYNEYIEEGKEYVEKGVTALSPIKQDVSENVTIKGTVDTTTPDTYKITYELDNVKITRNVIVYSTNLGTKEYYKFTIDLDGGTDNKDYESKYQTGTIIELEEPTKEGYVFKGWNVNGKGSSINGNKLTTGSGNIVLTAIWEPLGVTYIADLLEKESTLNNGLKQTYATINEEQVDAGIRYVGANPNNFVYFNCKDKDDNNKVYGSEIYDYKNSCEVWRIIGAFDVNNDTGKIQKRIKILRDIFPISISWDSSSSSVNSGYGINQWGESGSYEGADLMRLLNIYYTGESSTCSYCNLWKQGTCTNDCTNSIIPLSNVSLNMIEDAVWYLGSPTYNETISLLTMYESERSNQTGKTCSSGTYCTDSVTRTTEWLGKVGLIYPSDYAYASTDSNCEKDVYESDSSCKNNNWLNSKDGNVYWTITSLPYMDRGITILYVTPSRIGAADAYWAGDSSFTGIASARPTVYLSYDIQIKSGNGTSTSPYILAQ